MRATPAPAPVVEKLEGAAGTLTVRRVVHASVLLEAGGVAVLTDPWFTQTSAYNHGEPLGLSIDKLPKLTAVVASHGHHDHYDMTGFAAYPDKSVPMIVRPEMVQAARDAGFTDVRALEPWQSTEVGGVKVTVRRHGAVRGRDEDGGPERAASRSARARRRTSWVSTVPCVMLYTQPGAIDMRVVP